MCWTSATKYLIYSPKPNTAPESWKRFKATARTREATRVSIVWRWAIRLNAHPTIWTPVAWRLRSMSRWKSPQLIPTTSASLSRWTLATVTRRSLYANDQGRWAGRASPSGRKQAHQPSHPHGQRPDAWATARHRAVRFGLGACTLHRCSEAPPQRLIGAFEHACKGNREMALWNLLIEANVEELFAHKKHQA